MPDSPIIARVISPQGRTVELSAHTWVYVQRHTEMRNRLDLLLKTLQSPDLQEPDPRPGRERYWLRAHAPFQFRWIRAVVEFSGEVDCVVTAFGQDNDPEGLPK
jgi:hypothetical protein